MNTELEMGNFLKKLREKSGLTQADVAKALRYQTAQFVSNWERNLSYPPIKAIKKLSKLYRTSGDSIFEMILRGSLNITEKSLRQEYKVMKRL